jgi:hypothetical protein
MTFSKAYTLFTLAAILVTSTTPSLSFAMWSIDLEEIGQQRVVDRSQDLLERRNEDIRVLNSMIKQILKSPEPVGNIFYPKCYSTLSSASDLFKTTYLVNAELHNWVRTSLKSLKLSPIQAEFIYTEIKYLQTINQFSLLMSASGISDQIPEFFSLWAGKAFDSLTKRVEYLDQVNSSETDLRKLLRDSYFDQDFVQSIAVALKHTANESPVKKQVLQGRLQQVNYLLLNGSQFDRGAAQLTFLQDIMSSMSSIPIPPEFIAVVRNLSFMFSETGIIPSVVTETQRALINSPGEF